MSQPASGYNNAAKRSRRRKRTRSCILPRKRPAMPRKEYLSTFDPRFSPTAGIGKSQPAAGGSSPSGSLRQAASTPHPIDSHINPLHHVEIRLPDRRSRTFGAVAATGPHGPVKSAGHRPTAPRAETLTARSAKASASTNTAPTSSTPPTAKCGEFVNRFVEFNNHQLPGGQLQGKLYNLPFNMNTFYAMWGVTTPAQAAEMIDRQRHEAGISEPRNLEEQAISLVGIDI